MKKEYRKAVTIEAERFDGSAEMIEKYHIEYDGAYILPLRIETLEGWLGIKSGDWIATGAKSEHWPISDEIFNMTYVEVKDGV